MKKSILLTVTFIAYFLNVNAQCASSTNISSFSYNGSNYEIIKENKTWVNASLCAVERGGYLVEINSQGEQDAIFSAMNSAGINSANTVAPDGGGASYLWIGGNDIQTEGTWIWNGDNNGTSTQFWQGTSSGSSVGGLYSNWGNEPDNFNNQDALGIAFTNWPLGVAGEWNDIDESNSIYFIVEYPNTSGVYENSLQDIRVYPNPASNVVKMDLSQLKGDHKEIILLDKSGREIERHISKGDFFELDVSNLPKGIYSLVFINDGKESFLHSFIKE